MYDFKNFEKKWRDYWEESGLHVCDDSSPKPKYYCLDMFPYPSGIGLHVGHWRGYVLSDILARFKTLQGYNVLHPMGWDAFGLPAENDAIKKQKHPATNTKANIDNIKRQMKEIGAMYDWSREFSTTDPEYFKWTQWLFLLFYKRDLLYRANVPINWCPSCMCGLANEEVVQGKCERCGTETTKKDRLQWMMKITAYAERLLNDIGELDWSDKVKSMQRNWIGRSEGVEINFEIVDHDGNKHALPVYTTRPDTIFGVTYVVLAPEHHLVAKLSSQNKQKVEEYVLKTQKMESITRNKLDRQKTGVYLGVDAINPVTGDKIPVWVADYVLPEYGTGAVMAVPAHDTRDFEFAKNFDLPIIEVIHSDDADYDKDGNLANAYIEVGTMVNSQQFDGLDSNQAKQDIANFLVSNGWAEKKTNYRLRDWVYSRQRYWGEPIPIVYCDKCGEVPLPEEDLPILLPEVESYTISKTGDSPLAKCHDWVNTKCPKCGGPAKRETDTMPQWAGSSWYFLRFASPHCKEAVFDKEIVKKWMPVDMYVGGIEHAILHLLYARFFTKVLYDEGLIDFAEPFSKLFNQGMICSKSYRCNKCRKWWGYSELTDENHCPKCSGPLEVKMNKMSKSKANAVSPDELVESYGVDSIRLYELFMGPPDINVEWSTNGVQGCARFLRRYFSWVTKHAKQTGSDSDAVKIAHYELISNVTSRIENLHFNTAISAFMEFLNSVESQDLGNVSKDTLQNATICLSVFAPHLAEELWWNELGHKESIFKASWPQIDPSFVMPAKKKDVTLHVNGKLRAVVSVDEDASEEELKSIAVDNEKIKRFLEGKEVVKTIVIPNKMVNFVVK